MAATLTRIPRDRSQPNLAGNHSDVHCVVLTFTAGINCSILAPKSCTEDGAVWSPKPGWSGCPTHLPTNLAGFPKWPESATDEWCDALGLPTPMGTYPLVWPKITVPKRESNQWHSTAARGATPRSDATPSPRPATMKDSPTHCTMLDPIKWPREWVRAYAEGMRTTPTGGLSSLVWTRGTLERACSSRPRERLWDSDFLQLKPRYVCGILLPASMNCIMMNSCCLEASGVLKTSGKCERRKPWPWPELYKVVLIGLEGHIMSCAVLPKTFKSA